jgi:hypothetical protein
MAIPHPCPVREWVTACLRGVWPRMTPGRCSAILSLMRRPIPPVLLWLPFMACTSSTPEPTPTSQVPSKTEPERPLKGDACDDQIADYLAKRKQLSRCETDSDCAEMWPGLCPHGPYYIHRDADIADVVRHEQAIMANCEIPDCEPPMELGIAHCEQGTCAPGRAPASKGEESCWDYREDWLEADGSATATTSSTIQGITPHVAIAPASAGTLVLAIDWPADCADCRLLISEHNSGMANLITGNSTRSEDQRNGEPVQHESLEFPVKPGPYHMVGMASTDSNFTIRAKLRDADGKPGRVTRHGIGWQRMCEG